MSVLATAAYSMMVTQGQPGKPDPMDLALKEKMNGRSADRSDEDMLLRAKHAINEALTTYLWKYPDHGGMRSDKTFLVLH